MKLSVSQQKKLIQDDEIKRAFMRREDIVNLSPSQQRRRWKRQLEGIAKLRKWLSTLDSVVFRNDCSDQADSPKLFSP